jgi:hypothetical protein
MLFLNQKLFGLGSSREWRRLASWKKIYLSRGVCLTFIKGMLSNLATYFLSLFPLPIDIARYCCLLLPYQILVYALVYIDKVFHKSRRLQFLSKCYTCRVNLRIQFISNKDQLVDVFTKPLSSAWFEDQHIYLENA